MGEKRSRWRSRAALVTVLAAAAAVGTLACGVMSGEASDEVFVLAQGYTGPVVVVFGQADGAAEKHDGPRRVYDIPPGGVLRTRFGTRRRGWFTPVFRYGSPGGPSIPLGLEGSTPAGDPVLAWGTGTVGGVAYNESWVIARAAQRPAMEARLDTVRATLFPGAWPSGGLH